jgi:hypothetical protein
MKGSMTTHDFGKVLAAGRPEDENIRRPGVVADDKHIPRFPELSPNQRITVRDWRKLVQKEVDNPTLVDLLIGFAMRRNVGETELDEYAWAVASELKDRRVSALLNKLSFRDILPPHLFAS